MKNDGVPISRIRELLEHRGYQFRRVPGSHVEFRHSDPGRPEVLLPDGTKVVDEPQLRAMRRILDESGVLDAAEFDRELSRNGHAKRNGRAA